MLLYNIASVLDHENNHASGWRNGAKAYGAMEKSEQEQKAYLYQMRKSPFWEKTTPRFKIEIQRTAKKYIQP